MANFNDQVNNYIGRYFAHRPLEIRRVDTMKAFERAISGWMNDYFNESRFDARPSKHTGEHKKPVCGDSRHDLNYPEIPNSWVELFERFE